MQLRVHHVDIERRKVEPVCLGIDGGRIRHLKPIAASEADGFALPGFVDAHIHIESSMLVPSQFARVAVRHGTVATVSDPHEIANVLGGDGVEFMLRDAASVPLKFHFGAPSCVPATSFETAGAALSAESVASLLDHPEVHYLAEVMNYPGVLSKDPEVIQKIAAARQRRMPIDGHAPGVRGQDATRYFAEGISTDHECTTLDEAIEKLACGAHIQIREGSAARNFEALHPLFATHAGQLMLCSDDKHPDELLEGHINELCLRAVSEGHDLFDVLHAACLKPVRHYGLDVGTLRVGDPADFIVVDSLESIEVRQVWIDGVAVFDNGQVLFDSPPCVPENRWHARTIATEALAISHRPGHRIRVIEVEDGQIVTGQSVEEPAVREGRVTTDVGRDLMKLVSVNRYGDTQPAVAIVRGFGLQNGAIAGSVAHDSHNVLAVGADDDSIAAAVDRLMQGGGGLCCVDDDNTSFLPLPVAGLMSTESCETVAEDYLRLDAMAKRLGCPLRSPFMTLSFLGLLVIPSLKLSDQGLFDVEQFRFVDLFVEP